MQFWKKIIGVIYLPSLVHIVILFTYICNNWAFSQVPVDSSELKEFYTRASQFHSRNLDSAEFDARQALLLATKSGYKEWEARTNAVLGNILQTKGGDKYTTEALTYHQNSLEIYRELRVPIKTLTALTNLSNTYRRLDDYPNTLKYAIEAAELSKGLDNKNNLQKGIVHGTLANIYNDMGLIDSAIVNYKKTKVYLSEIKTPFQYYADANLGRIYEDLEQYDSAQRAYENAYAGFVAQQDSFSMAKLMGFLGFLVLKKKEFQKARGYYQSGLRLSKHLEVSSVTLKMLQGLAETYYELKNDDSTLFYTERAYILADSLDFLLEKSEILELKSELAKRKGNTKAALRYLEESGILKDSLENRRRLAESTEVLIASQNKSYKEESLGLYRSINQKNMALISIVSAMAILGAVSFILFRTKERKIDQQAVRLQRRELDKQRLQHQLEKKKQEFIDHVLKNFNNKDRLLKSVTGNAVLDPERLTDEIHKIYYGQDKWLDFRKRFSDVHPLFYTNLQKKYSNLTNRDLDLLALVHLRFSTKEIAELLNISTEGVERPGTGFAKK